MFVKAALPLGGTANKSRNQPLKTGFIFFISSSLTKANVLKYQLHGRNFSRGKYNKKNPEIQGFI